MNSFDGTSIWSYDSCIGSLCLTNFYNDQPVGCWLKSCSFTVKFIETKHFISLKRLYIFFCKFSISHALLIETVQATIFTLSTCVCGGSGILRQVSTNERTNLSLVF